jgi:hypothetical protein
MIRGILLAAGMTAMVLAGCATRDTSVPEHAINRARTALAPFKSELMGALREALHEGGPENALEVCRWKAPEIAAAKSGNGVTIGRTSHRLRNPANAPEPWMERLLRSYESDPADTTSRAVRLDATHVGYVEPIHVKPLCLTCHGTELEEPVQHALASLYPEDQATGFAAGDFRGMFWVKVTLEEPAP